MAKERNTLRMVIFIKANMLMDYQKDMENILGAMEDITKAILNKD